MNKLLTTSFTIFMVLLFLALYVGYIFADSDLNDTLVISPNKTSIVPGEEQIIELKTHSIPGSNVTFFSPNVSDHLSMSFVPNSVTVDSSGIEVSYAKIRAAPSLLPDNYTIPINRNVSSLTTQGQTSYTLGLPYNVSVSNPLTLSAVQVSFPSIPIEYLIGLYTLSCRYIYKLACSKPRSVLQFQKSAN